MSGNNRNVLSTVREIINQTDFLQISMIFCKGNIPEVNSIYYTLMDIDLIEKDAIFKKS